MPLRHPARLGTETLSQEPIPTLNPSTTTDIGDDPPGFSPWSDGYVGTGKQLMPAIQA